MNMLLLINVNVYRHTLYLTNILFYQNYSNMLLLINVKVLDKCILSFISNIIVELLVIIYYITYCIFHINKIKLYSYKRIRRRKTRQVLFD